jgi:uncharacterized protein YbaR (Trm112 family)
MALDDRLLDILGCAIDKGPLLYFVDENALYNPRLCRLYRIESNIPLMRADQAQPVNAEGHRLLIDRAVAGHARTTIGAHLDDVLRTAGIPAS